MPDVGTRGTINGQLVEWDGHGWSAVSDQASMPRPNARTWTDTAVDTLPALGGTLGGIVGGIGGTVGGFGVGGVPGAMGGAALGGVAGESARQIVQRLRGAPPPTSTLEAMAGQGAPATMTDAALGLGGQALIQGGAEGIGQAAVKGLAAGGKAVYRGYLKPSLAGNALAEGKQIVQTAIDEALPVTDAGVKQAQNVIGDLRRQVDNILATTRGKVDLHAVADRVRTFAKGKYFKPGVPSADYDAALAVADSIDKHASLALPAGATPTRVDVPLAQANTIKQGLYTTIGDANYGLERGATKTTQKVAASELRQDIEAGAKAGGAPDVGPLNAREGRLMDAADAIAHAVGRVSNADKLVGVKTLAGFAAGEENYRRTNDPFSAAVWMLGTRAALSPAVMTRAAIVAAKLGQMTSGEVPATIARLAVQAVLKTEQVPEHVPEEMGK